MRITWDESEPDTHEYRLRRLLTEWQLKRNMRSYCPDLLTLEERLAAQIQLNNKLQEAKKWLVKRQAELALANKYQKVVPIKIAGRKRNP